MKDLIINWVCNDCAKSKGAKQPSWHIATYHLGICDLCKKEKDVTEPRDYGKARHLLYNNIKFKIKYKESDLKELEKFLKGHGYKEVKPKKKSKKK